MAEKLTGQLFDDLFVDAMGGDSAAYDAFYENARKLAKRVNQQMLQMERRGIDSEGYKMARAILGDKKRFKENVSGMNIDVLRDEVDNLLSITYRKDYSLPYASNVDFSKQIESISNSNLFKTAGIDLTNDRVKYELNEFLKTDAFQEYKRVWGGTDIVRAAEDHFQNGGTYTDLVRAFETYSSGRDKGDMIKTWYKATGTLL